MRFLPLFFLLICWGCSAPRSSQGSPPISPAALSGVEPNEDQEDPVSPAPSSEPEGIVATPNGDGTYTWHGLDAFVDALLESEKGYNALAERIRLSKDYDELCGHVGTTFYHAARQGLLEMGEGEFTFCVAEYLGREQEFFWDVANRIVRDFAHMDFRGGNQGSAERIAKAKNKSLASDERAKAVRYLGYTKDPTFQPLYREFLLGGNLALRRASAVALLALTADPAFDSREELEKVALESKDENTVLLALSALRELSDPRSVPTLIKVINREYAIEMSWYDEQIVAVETLGQIGLPAAVAVPEIGQWLASNHSGFSRLACEAIAKIDHPSGIPSLGRVLTMTWDERRTLDVTTAAQALLRMSHPLAFQSVVAGIDFQFAHPEHSQSRYAERKNETRDELLKVALESADSRFKPHLKRWQTLLAAERQQVLSTN